MKVTHHLALDLGAESGRAIVGSLSNAVLALTEVHRFANTPLKESSGLHWDVRALWQEIKKGIHLSAGQFRLESLGLDTWGWTLPCSTGKKP